MKGLFSDAPIQDVRAELLADIDLLPEQELRHCHYILGVTFERVLGKATMAKIAAKATKKQRRRRLPSNVVQLFPAHR